MVNDFLREGKIMKIGIDIGGSHLGMALINDDYKIVSKKEIDLPKDRSNIEDYIVRAIKNTVLGINKDISLIGICCCGTVKDGEIVKSVNLGIRNFNIVRILREELKYSEKINTPIILRNDTNCAAIAEKNLGSLEDYDDALFLTVGTGIGGAYFYNGKLVEPKRFPGFEVGHMTIEKEGILCNCGNHGCFEKYGSISALKAKVKEEYRIDILTGEKLVEMIREKRKFEGTSEYDRMEAILVDYTKSLAIGISNLINILEPEIVSLGGSFAYYEDLLLYRVDKNIKIFNDYSKPELVCAELKNDAGILGAVIT